jgi:rhodanese-related sulfurtransferase
MKNLYFIASLIMMLALAWSCKGEEKKAAYDTLDTASFEQLIADSTHVVLLDVRSLSEYEEKHLPGAQLLDVKEDSFMVKAQERLPKEKTIAVYCRSGRRSASAAGMLTAEGYKVVNLQGGIEAWTKAGKPTE